jgi:trehalose synthase-fused probable maltokinase
MRVSRPDLAKAIAAGDASALPEGALAAWATTQRWFSSKSRRASEFRVLDLVNLESDYPIVAIVVAQARFDSGTHELYQVPIAVRPLASGWNAGVIWADEAHVVYDALLDEAADAVLAHQFAAGTTIDRPSGCVSFHWDEAFAPPSEQPAMRTMGAEQSNTSVVLDERLALKVFRRIQPGINPELEMLRFLAAHSFANIAALTGWYTYTGELIDATLGVVQRYIGGSRDGWELALEALSAGDRSFLGRLGELGAATGRMHATLASVSDDPAFAPEEPTVENLALFTASLDEQIERVFDDLPELPELEPIAGRGEEVRDHLRSLSHIGVGGRLIRIHGDYHLGQTVLGPEDWVILDFEGEPGRPLLDRRRKRSPLRDVAGMVRSLAYAASAAPMLRGADVPADWEQEARGRFIDGYMATADPAILPAGGPALEKLLAIFELERAIYELRYELDNRPDWVGIPVACIARLLGQTPA